MKKIRMKDTCTGGIVHGQLVSNGITEYFSSKVILNYLTMFVYQMVCNDTFMCTH